jgi:hypothetical protein
MGTFAKGTPVASRNVPALTGICTTDPHTVDTPHGPRTAISVLWKTGTESRYFTDSLMIRTARLGDARWWDMSTPAERNSPVTEFPENGQYPACDHPGVFASGRDTEFCPTCGKNIPYQDL